MTGGPEAGGRLEVERSGGLAGLRLHAIVRLVELSPEERRALDQALESGAARPSGPDRFVYRLRVGEREAVVQEDRLPPALGPLVRRLGGRWS